jgi:hypothetical protein
MSLLVGRCMPGRRRERRSELQPPVTEEQPPHAAVTQSGCERRRKGQRKHLRNCVSPHGTASWARTNHRSHCASTVSPDLADPAPGSSIRRTGPSGHQTIEAKTHGQNTPAAPKPRLSNRTTQPSTQPSTSAVIFEPGGYFLVGDFSVEVLHEGRARYGQLSEHLGKNMTAPCRGNPGPQHSAKFRQIPKLPLCSVGTLGSFARNLVQNKPGVPPQTFKPVRA